MPVIKEPASTNRAQEDHLVINGDYLKEHASEAVATFFAPLLSVYGAATGKRVRLYRDRRSRRAA